MDELDSIGIILLGIIVLVVGLYAYAIAMEVVRFVFNG